MTWPFTNQPVPTHFPCSHKREPDNLYYSAGRIRCLTCHKERYRRKREQMGKKVK